MHIMSISYACFAFNLMARSEKRVNLRETVVLREISKRSRLVHENGRLKNQLSSYHKL